MNAKLHFVEDQRWYQFQGHRNLYCKTSISVEYSQKLIKSLALWLCNMEEFLHSQKWVHHFARGLCRNNWQPIPSDRTSNSILYFTRINNFHLQSNIYCSFCVRDGYSSSATSQSICQLFQPRRMHSKPLEYRSNFVEVD